MGVRVREKGGCWYVFINHQNRRKAKKVGPGPAGYRLATQLADRLQVRLSFGESLDPAPKGPTLAEYTESWLNMVRTLRKTSTWEAYSRIMTNYWLPPLGQKPLHEITRSHVRRVLIDLQRRGLSSTYVRAILTALQSCLAEAIDEELITVSPAMRQRRSLAPSAQSAVEIFSAEELRLLLETALVRMPPMYAKILILARTGMREGEMLALQYGDLDIEQRTIAVRRTWGSRNTQKNLGCINTPKSGKTRVVDMSAQLAQALQALGPGKRPGDWLFPGGVGTRLPMTPNGFAYHWARLLRVAGLPHRKPNVLRHTFASMLLAAGENMLYVKDQLGHASIKITMDTYGHLIKRPGPSGVDRLDDPEICNLSATEGLQLIQGGDINP